MATQTPNLGLTLPVGTENVSRTVINGNNTLIDTFAGNVNTAMDQMGSNLGILETGDTATHAIAKGEYVTWKGASYTADAAISIGETLAATGGSKNLTACDKGIANALNSKIELLMDREISTTVTNYTVPNIKNYDLLCIGVAQELSSNARYSGQQTIPVAMFVRSNSSFDLTLSEGNAYYVNDTTIAMSKKSSATTTRYGIIYGIKC